MLTSPVISVIAGTVLGFLSGIGVGGGTLLMLWLTVFLHIDHPIARSINLLFFIPSALIASFLRRKQGALKIKKVLPAMVAGCLCAALFSQISKNISPDYIRKIFGVLLLITGIREILYRPKNAAAQRRRNAK